MISGWTRADKHHTDWHAFHYPEQTADNTDQTRKESPSLRWSHSEVNYATRQRLKCGFLWRETPGNESVSRQAASTPRCIPETREKKNKKKGKKASITCWGTDERTGALRAGSDGDDSGVLPGAQGATRQESDGCGHPERWMLLDDDEWRGRRAREGEREAKKWLRWNWPCAKPARGFPCWCLLSWAGGGGVTGTSPLCAFWPTSLHDIFPNLMRQQRPQTKLQPVNWGVCDLTDLILLQNQEIREWFYLKLAETLKENILSSWVILVLKNFLTLDI